jgi:hypothetical protein
MTKRLPSLLGFYLLGCLLLSACGSGAAEATPTLSVEAIQTRAVAIFASDLTQTALAMPSPTPTPTDTPSPTATSTPAPTDTPATLLATAASSMPTSSCYSLAFVADVTIPDNTTMTPGQNFTKTWRVKNNGSCTWEAGFKFSFTGGEAMGATPLALANAVSKGTETELSVALTAPTTPGTYRGNWRMAMASGSYFGDEVYVLIVVGSSTAISSTLTITVTPTATGTPTETPTS